MMSYGVPPNGSLAVIRQVVALRSAYQRRIDELWRSSGEAQKQHNAPLAQSPRLAGVCKLLQAPEEVKKSVTQQLALVVR